MPAGKFPCLYHCVSAGKQLSSISDRYQDTQQCVVRPNKMGCAQTGVSILTGITKSQFSRIHRSVIFYLKNTEFAVEVLVYNRKLHSKVEVNCVSRFQDTSDQSFGFCSSLFFFFLHKHKNHSNSGMHSSIELKFGATKGK